MAAIKAQPNWGFPYYEAGLIISASGDEETAAMFFEQSFALCRHPGALFNLSQCLKSVGDIGSALSLMRQYTEIDPSDPEGHFALGCLYMRLEETDQEIACYQRALQIAPRYVPAHLNLGSTYVQLRTNQQEAKHHLEFVLQESKDPEMTHQARTALARLYD